MSNPLTAEEQRRLDELTSMDSDHPDFNVLEFVELHYKTNPEMTNEQRIRESEDEW